MRAATFILSLALVAVGVLSSPIPSSNIESDSEASVPSEDSCSAICGLQRVKGAKSEREALCSVEGLKVTLDCASCIDTTWPDTTWEDSAMAEYDRIVEACQASPQRVYRSTDR